MTTSLVSLPPSHDARAGDYAFAALAYHHTLRRMGRLLPGAPLPLGPFLIGAAMIVLLWP